MKNKYILTISVLLLTGCSSVTAPKFENGQYVPPPAANALDIELSEKSCDPNAAGAFVEFIHPLLSIVAPVVFNQVYDRFVNWFEEKKANLSASSTGVLTTTFLIAPNNPKQCLKLKRADSLSAEFNISRVGNGKYWHMTPYSVVFKKSEAKEAPQSEKSLVAAIVFAVPNAEGKFTTFFETTFDLGKRKAALNNSYTGIFIGQDSGPYGVPKVDASDSDITMKVVASLTEHGEGRDWIRGAATSLREQENKDKALKLFLEAIGNSPKP